MLTNDVKNTIKQNNLEKSKKLGIETRISIFYIEEKVCQKYPNLKLIKVICDYDYKGLKEFYLGSKPSDNDMYFYAFIERDKISDLFVENNDSRIPIINVNKLKRDGETIFKTRNDILIECSIFVQRSEYDDLSNNIVAIYPCTIKYYDDPFLEDTKLLLASVLNKISQEELNNLSLEILNYAELGTKNCADNEINILKRIKEKIANNCLLNGDEIIILNKAIDKNINEVKDDTNILKYTLEKRN